MGLITHGDLKPENILLDSRGALKASDFGIVKISEVVSGRRPLGDPGLHGSRAGPGSVSERSDVFVLGVVLYECLTGHNPLLEGLREPLELPGRATAYDPADGPSMGELRAKLGLMLARLTEA